MNIQDYIALITSEHRARPNFAAVMTALLQPPVDTANAALALQDRFNLDTAVGDQLDTIGLWVGVTRKLPLTIEGVYFTWAGTVDTGWNVGVWKGPFDPTAGVISLTDEDFRILIRAKIAANNWDGTAESMKAIYDDLFGPDTVWVTDKQDMSIELRYRRSISPVITAMITSGMIPLKPAGVSLDIIPVASPSPIITVPLPQTLWTLGSDISITTSFAGTVTADGVNLGAANPTLVWTPPALDYDVRLQAVAYGANPSPEVPIAVVEANHISTNLAAWTRTNIGAVTSGQQDPDGGNNAYRITMNNSAGAAQAHRLQGTAAPASTAPNSSLEVWAEYDPSVPVLFIYNFNDQYCYINLLTEQCTGNWSACAVVETKVVAGTTWKRIWFGCTRGEQITNFWFGFTNSLDPLQAGFVTTGTESLRLYNPRVVDGAIPFYDWQRSKYYFDSTTGNVDKWYTQNPWQDTDASGNVQRALYVLKPNTYNPANTYPVCYILDVEPSPNVYPDMLAKVAGYGLHNTYQCIFVRSDWQSFPWFGVWPDGKTENYETVVCEVMRHLMDTYYSTIRTREGRLNIGYSKGSWGGRHLLLRHPDIFGYCGSWDTPGTAGAIANGALGAFNNDNAQFNIYDPEQIVASHVSAVNDRARFVIATGGTFTAEDTNFHNVLTANHVDHTFIPVTYEGLAHGGFGVNDFDWMPGVFAAMWAQRTA